jgi:hypothetical protein
MTAYPERADIERNGQKYTGRRDGEHYWDGGCSPTRMLDYSPRRSRLTFQVDVFQAQGWLPNATRIFGLAPIAKGAGCAGVRCHVMLSARKKSTREHIRTSSSSVCESKQPAVDIKSEHRPASDRNGPPVRIGMHHGLYRNPRSTRPGAARSATSIRSGVVGFGPSAVLERLLGSIVSSEVESRCLDVSRGAKLGDRPEVDSCGAVECWRLALDQQTVEIEFEGAKVSEARR